MGTKSCRSQFKGQVNFLAHNRSQQRNRQEAHAKPPDSPQRYSGTFPSWLSIRLPPFPCQTIGAAALKVAPQRRGQHAEEERKTARGGGLFSPRVERRGHPDVVSPLIAISEVPAVDIREDRSEAVTG